MRIHEGLGDLLGLQGGQHRTQLGSGAHLGSWGTQRARGLVVTGAVAERADHVVRLWEVRVVRFAESLVGCLMKQLCFM